jgi:hypothetical protein
MSLGSALGIERDYLIDTLSSRPVASPLLSYKKGFGRLDFSAVFKLLEND